MAERCPITLDVAALRDAVVATYHEVAACPEGAFHFHTGPAFAVEALGYDAAALAKLPAEATAAFAGVANPHAAAPFALGETVLDVGAGAGTDLLLAALAVGASGRAIGVDFTAEMRARAGRAVRVLGLANVDIRAGDASGLPVETGSIDVVISNGVLNLVPDKRRAFGEMARVLRPGGRLQLGDIAVAEELPLEVRADIDLWTG
jgi:SAM-dependent methyltransferase